MSKTTNINIQIDSEFMSELEKLYSQYGLSITEAINIFLHVFLIEVVFHLKLFRRDTTQKQNLL